ncbi:MAG: glycosyltransferase family 4 protein [Patescibacteria group bacterium]|nr:glycosyltransferase family 4 protein [Patescibacteria group bacterium]
MKIAINTLAMKSTYHGMGRYLKNLLENLYLLDKENEYLLYVSKENKKLIESFFTPNTKAKEINIPTSLRILWEHTFLPLDLKKEKVDVYFGPSHILPIVKATKEVVTIHDMTWFSQANKHTKFKRLYFQNLVPISIKQADLVLADSEATKNDIIEITKVPPLKVEVAYLGVDDYFRKAPEKEIERVREKYHLHKPYIFDVGVIEPRKNILGLIEAYFKILKKDSQFPYDLAIAGGKGYGWNNEEIFTFVNSKKLDNRVLFLDAVPDEDLPPLLSGAALFVYPSFYEGFGLPILEAMKCGVPVVTSKISSLTEVGGEAAFYVDPNDVGSISQAIELVLKDKKKQREMVDKGFVQSGLFTWQKTAEKTLEAFSKIVNIKRKND